MDGVGEEADTADGGDRRPRRLDGVREQDLPETLSLRRSDASGRVVLALLLLRHPCEPLIERRLTAAKASTDVLVSQQFDAVGHSEISRGVRGNDGAWRSGVGGCRAARARSAKGVDLVACIL
jgi:hypothetical protein